jgi:hypothetical protein
MLCHVLMTVNAVDAAQSNLHRDRFDRSGQNDDEAHQA